jgi:hypothetical protein
LSEAEKIEEERLDINETVTIVSEGKEDEENCMLNETLSAKTCLSVIPVPTHWCDASCGFFPLSFIF